MQSTGFEISPRDFPYVRRKIEAVIRRGNEGEARSAAVSLVDEWAAIVIATHRGTARFPVQVLAEFTTAETMRFFGTLGGAPNQPAEVSKWVFECNRLVSDRLRHWANQSVRFRTAQ